MGSAPSSYDEAFICKASKRAYLSRIWTSQVFFSSISFNSPLGVTEKELGISFPLDQFGSYNTPAV